MTGESDLPYTVSDAARLLGVSERTVRRRLEDPGDGLEKVHGRQPILVTSNSLLAARRQLASELELYLEAASESHGDQLEVLRLENERLRRLVQTLRLAQAELLRCIGDFADPTIPNN